MRHTRETLSRREVEKRETLEESREKRRVPRDSPRNPTFEGYERATARACSRRAHEVESETEVPGGFILFLSLSLSLSLSLFLCVCVSLPARRSRLAISTTLAISSFVQGWRWVRP